MGPLFPQSAQAGALRGSIETAGLRVRCWSCVYASAPRSTGPRQSGRALRLHRRNTSKSQGVAAKSERDGLATGVNMAVRRISAHLRRDAMPGRSGSTDMILNVSPWSKAGCGRGTGTGSARPESRPQSSAELSPSRHSTAPQPCGSRHSGKGLHKCCINYKRPDELHLDVHLSGQAFRDQPRTGACPPWIPSTPRAVRQCHALPDPETA